MLYMIKVGDQWLGAGDVLVTDPRKAEIFAGSPSRAETLRDYCALRFNAVAKLERVKLARVAP